MEPRRKFASLSRYRQLAEPACTYHRTWFTTNHRFVGLHLAGQTLVASVVPAMQS